MRGRGESRFEPVKSGLAPPTIVVTLAAVAWHGLPSSVTTRPDPDVAAVGRHALPFEGGSQVVETLTDGRVDVDLLLDRGREAIGLRNAGKVVFPAPPSRSARSLRLSTGSGSFRVVVDAGDGDPWIDAEVAGVPLTTASLGPRGQASVDRLTLHVGRPDDVEVVDR